MREAATPLVRLLSEARPCLGLRAEGAPKSVVPAMRRARPAYALYRDAEAACCASTSSLRVRRHAPLADRIKIAPGAEPPEPMRGMWMTTDDTPGWRTAYGPGV